MTRIVLHNGLAHRILQVIIVAVLLPGTSCAPSGPAIKVELSGSSFQVNNLVTTSVYVEDLEDLIGFEAHLSFDPNVLEVMELKNGGFIQADFIVQNTFDNTAGTIDYAVAQIDSPPAKGSGMLLKIIFRAKAPGQSSISFRGTQAAPAGILLSDSNGQEIPVSSQEGNVYVSAP